MTVPCACSPGVDPCPVLEFPVYPLGHCRGYPVIHSLADAVNLSSNAICRYLVGWIGGIARMRLRRDVRRSERSTSTVGIGESGSVLDAASVGVVSDDGEENGLPLVVIPVKIAKRVL